MTQLQTDIGIRYSAGHLQTDLGITAGSLGAQEGNLRRVTVGRTRSQNTR